MWCGWDLAWGSDSHPADVEVASGGAGLELALVCFSFELKFFY